MPELADPTKTADNPAGTPVVGAPEAGAVADDVGDLTPPAANTWWQFDTQEAAEEWANNLVSKRLTRERKTKLTPLEEKTATLEAEIERLKPFEQATLSESEKRDAREAALQQELSELRDWRKGIERQELLSDIAAEEGLDPKFLKFVKTDGDADAIRTEITDLLNVLSEGGSDTGKRKPASKAPQEPGDGSKGGTLQAGGGGNDGDETPEQMVASIVEEVRKNRANGGLVVRR